MTIHTIFRTFFLALQSAFRPPFKKVSQVPESDVCHSQIKCANPYFFVLLCFLTTTYFSLTHILDHWPSQCLPFLKKKSKNQILKIWQEI